MEAFTWVSSLSSSDWDFIVKLDGDVGLPADASSSVFQRFSEDSSLAWRRESCIGWRTAPNAGAHPPMHVRGRSSYARAVLGRDRRADQDSWMGHGR
jgi:hypothetical protein